MEIARIQVERNVLRVRPCAAVTRGLVGAAVIFEGFGPEWDRLSKTAVFRTQTVVRDVVNVQPGEPVVIPWEVLETAMTELMVGISGTNGAGTVVITSEWGSLGRIAPGACPAGRPAEPPTATWTQQIEGQVNAAMEAALEVRPLTKQAEASAGTAGEKAAAAAGSEQAAGEFADAAQKHAYAAARGAQHAEQMASEAAGRMETAETHALAAASARTVAEKATQTASVSAQAAADRSREAAVQAERAKAEADRAEAEADRAAGLIDDTVTDPGKTYSSRKIREDADALREGVLRGVCPVMNQSGAVVSCIPLAERPLQLQARFQARQDGTGEAAMDNGRKLKPVNEVTVFQSGINFLNLNGEPAGGEQYAYNFMPETGRIFRAACPPEQYRRIMIRVPPNTDLYLAADTMNFRSVVQISNIGLGGDAVDASIQNGTVLSVKFNSGDHDRLIVSFYTAGEQIEYNVEGVRVTMAEDGRTDFEPYFEDIRQARFSQPVWGGRADLTGGSLECFGEVVDLENWPYALKVESHNCVTIPGAYERYTRVLGFSHGLAQAEQPGKSSAGLFYGQIYIHTDPLTVDSIEDWNRFTAEQKAAGTPVQILCEKIDPEVLTTAPIVLKGVKGVNKIYSPQGRITVSGLSDPGEIINELTRRMTDLENRTESLNGGI